MGLFRNRRSDGSTGADRYDDPLRGTDPSEEDGFAPRTDGDYLAGPYILRFARPVVTETDPAQAALGRGEFTDGGRFIIERPFARPVVYTVLVVDAEGAPLRLRRTDTGSRQSAEWDVTFAPDAE